MQSKKACFHQPTSENDNYESDDANNNSDSSCNRLLDSGPAFPSEAAVLEQLNNDSLLDRTTNKVKAMKPCDPCKDNSKPHSKFAAIPHLAAIPHPPINVDKEHVAKKKKTFHQQRANLKKPGVAEVHAFLRPIVQEHIDSGRPVDSSIRSIRGGLTQIETECLKKEINRIMKAKGVNLTLKQLSPRCIYHVDQVTASMVVNDGNAKPRPVNPSIKHKADDTKPKADHTLTVTGKPKTHGKKASPVHAAVHAYLCPIVQEHIDSGRPVNSSRCIRAGLTQNEKECMKEEINGILKANCVNLTLKQLNDRHNNLINKVSGTHSHVKQIENMDPEKCQQNAEHIK
jgi:(2Fe-2S) ferredoxin